MGSARVILSILGAALAAWSTGATAQNDRATPPPTEDRSEADSAQRASLGGRANTLPYYSAAELKVFAAASRQHGEALECRGKDPPDYERWARSITELYDLAGMIGADEGRASSASRLAVNYGRAAIDELVETIEIRESHAGAVATQRALGARIGREAFPSDDYEGRLQVVINKYDAALAALKRDTAPGHGTEECRMALHAFLERARRLDVREKLIVQSTSPVVDDLVARIVDVTNVLEARRLLGDELASPLLSVPQRAALRRVAGREE